MTKIFMYVNKLLVKVTGHRYTGFTIKMPFINLSFAPVQRYSSQWSCFLYKENHSLYEWFNEAYGDE